MKISIIGTGYVGLPTGVGFAELGHDVVCIDKMQSKIDYLNAGNLTLFEDGLEELFNKNRNCGRIKFTTDFSQISDVDFIIITVGTPQCPVSKEPDMKFVYAAAEDISPFLTGYTAIANKSTVLIGTSDKLENIIKTTNPHADFDLVAIPEFLREGFAVHDFFHPERIVVGVESEKAVAYVNKLYSVFHERLNILYVNRCSAELIKYASNAFLAIKLNFINEIADLCEKVGANVNDVAKCMGLDSRIGTKFLNPGPGYGGSCFPKDTNSLLYMAKQNGIDLSLVEATIIENEARKSKMAKKILNSVVGIEKPLISVWGLSFKAGTDDVRESPALQIIQELTSHAVDVIAFDPKAKDTAFSILGNTISYADSAIESTVGADVLAVLTEWPEFKNVPLEKLQMRRKYIIDLRNILDFDSAKSAGFTYVGIGNREMKKSVNSD
ncbi:MAG: UDP-glucose/GDP-mannose dehydrogenase family protein [Acinetobacter sp.]|jgi:UDPglucose 6-dehydrogenase|uniref:UDP-glucose dehydrogenase family protein n=1 Tax=Acinetobacter sp. TaxID=472 RepID=UPI0028249064|nr:UDP-glucose/GDP-mannose dehydrogenase family protein [Acinetobacter sp.]MDR2061852.1 UDP-glucose/GDP-mannose dehydrogenase family protein [Acinetobacter sp.]